MYEGVFSMTNVKKTKRSKYLMVNQCHLVDENGSYRINIFCWGMKLSPVG